MMGGEPCLFDYIKKIDDRALFMKGIDVSYFYEGYSQYKTEDL